LQDGYETGSVRVSVSVPAQRVVCSRFNDATPATNPNPTKPNATPRNARAHALAELDGLVQSGHDGGHLQVGLQGLDRQLHALDGGLEGVDAAKGALDDVVVPDGGLFGWVGGLGGGRFG